MNSIIKNLLEKPANECSDREAMLIIKLRNVPENQQEAFFKGFVDGWRDCNEQYWNFWKSNKVEDIL